MSIAERPADEDAGQRHGLALRFSKTRQCSEAIAAPLSVEDQAIQSMPDVSPTKWHLAHTTWFWETFVLGPNLTGYETCDGRFNYLFNSYYEGVGERHPRPQRGLLSRPSLDEVHAYRRHVQGAMERLFRDLSDARFSPLAPLIQLGLSHEEQHQELLLMDIKHVLSCNPFHPPAYLPPAHISLLSGPLSWTDHAGGLAEVGWSGGGFAFDNEGPRHRVWLEPFALADRPATNAEYAAFIEDGGYRSAGLWLSDGWAWAQQAGRTAPAYWVRSDGAWMQFTLHGLVPLDPESPVCHLTFYEAAAFAEWMGARLPTEAEWETAAAPHDPDAGDFMTPGHSSEPAPVAGQGARGLFGHVWEWTGSAYLPYPGFRPEAGAVGEYNGKFMSGQMVLRGGSCATVRGHMRTTYRNFFYPHQSWQFAGLRLARDI